VRTQNHNALKQPLLRPCACMVFGTPQKRPKQPIDSTVIFWLHFFYSESSESIFLKNEFRREKMESEDRSGVSGFLKHFLRDRIATFLGIVQPCNQFENFATFLKGIRIRTNLWKFFLPKQPYGGKIMRKIDCVHSRIVKMLVWPWFREIDVCIEAKIENFWNFPLKIIFLGIISCEKSIVRILEAWKRFPDPDSGKLVHVEFSLQYTLLFLNQSQESIFKATNLQPFSLYSAIILKNVFDHPHRSAR
jgi:hypothetical protein